MRKPPMSVMGPACQIDGESAPVTGHSHANALNMSDQCAYDLLARIIHEMA